jgi:D-inositol-3-phosphate glycosyltransferase
VRRRASRRRPPLRKRVAETWELWATPLRWRAAATQRLWRPEAGRRIGLFTPDPFPAGVVDYPPSEAKLPRGPLTVSGWALFPQDAVAHIEIWLGEEWLGRARLGIPRPDVRQSRNQPRAGISGFELVTDLARWPGPDGSATLQTTATSVSGETHELDRVKINVGVKKKPVRAKLLQAPPARTPQPAGDRKTHLMVCTHQLNLGGAQLYLLDLLSELIKSEAIEATVVSGLDGPLREDLEELGIPVHISSLVPVDDLSSHIGRVEELTAWAADRDFDAAFVNTATPLALSGAEAASQLEIPAIWAIHESFAPAVLWSGMHPDIRERAEATLAEAALVVFEAEATQRLYEPPLRSSQCVTLPYGLDLGPIEAERAEFDMAAARRKASVPESADVLLCVGTVEARKAQIPLAQAFDLIAGDHPDAHLVIVGGGANLDSIALREWIREAEWGDRLRLIPVTPDVHSWYALADLLVCASDIESLPRTVLEAMAFETPVLATEVFGIPELIEDGKTGWLCEPRDVKVLAEALDRFLKTPEEVRRQVARASRKLVEERHYLPEYANQISKQLDRVIESHSSEPQRRIATR